MGKYRPSKRFTKKRNSGMFISVKDFGSYEKKHLKNWISNVDKRGKDTESKEGNLILTTQYRLKYRTRNNYKLLWMYEVH